DAEFQSKMAEFLDLKLFLAHLAVEVFLSEGDGILGENGMANFYLYRFTGKNLHQFIAWDKDSVMGEIDRQVLKNTEKNVLIRRTLAVPQLRGYFLETILKLAALAGGPDGWLAREVAKEYNQIREAVRSDNIKPCTEDVTKPCALDRSNQLFEQSIAYVKAFANGRSAFVLRDVANAGFELSSAGPRLADRGALNAATNVVGGAIAPGSYVSVYGERLDGAAQVTPKPLGPGVSVWMNGFPAPLAYVSAGIVNVVAPWELVPGAIPVTAIVDGSISNTITADVAAYSPGVFAITHADYSAVTAGNPATGGEVLLLFANGLGPVTVDMTTGRGAPGGPFAETKEKPKVTFAGLDGEVQFSGLVPGVLALYQINVQLPASVPAGTDTPVIVSIGGQSAPPSPIATR
ncbi:MAG: CotH kinase family protein, partial [Acidobacteria bacterium]|nr:CotH kinase family protein [Acidobacteriota bacterium]